MLQRFKIAPDTEWHGEPLHFFTGDGDIPIEAENNPLMASMSTTYMVCTEVQYCVDAGAPGGPSCSTDVYCVTYGGGGGNTGGNNGEIEGGPTGGGGGSSGDGGGSTGDDSNTGEEPDPCDGPNADQYELCQNEPSDEVVAPAIAPEGVSQEAFNLMTPEERIRCWEFKAQSGVVAGATLAAIAIAKTIQIANDYPIDSSPSNAFKHTYWNAMMTRGLMSKSLAKTWADLHETSKGNPAPDADYIDPATAMDYWNNAVGRDIGWAYRFTSPGAIEAAVLDAMNDDLLREWACGPWPGEQDAQC